MNGLLNVKGEIKFKLLLKMIEKIDSCDHCSYTQPKFTGSNDGKNNILSIFTIGKEIKKFIKSPEEIKMIFDNISDNDVKLLGLDPNHTHPKNFITNIIPVLPPRSRPRVSSENNLCDDDITIQYCEIIKKSAKLKSIGNKEDPKYTKEFDKMYFKIKSMFDNSNAKAKHSNGRAIKGIKERISGKDGLIRNNLLGKRVNQSSRTVIGPDPTLRSGEVAVPEIIAAQLTIPETVNIYNLNNMQSLVDNDKANFYTPKGTDKRINLKYALFQKGTPIINGDVVIRKGIPLENDDIILEEGDTIIRNGVILDNIKYPKRKSLRLKIGDVVERQLQNGDYVLLNRQPTLHSGSIIAHKVVIRPYKTFRFNLATTSSLNADFDGDRLLSSTGRCLYSC